MRFSSSFLLRICAILYCVYVSQALICWTCKNMEIRACMFYGRPRVCKNNEKSCETSVRYDKNKPTIIEYTGCKESSACLNNERQNLASAGNGNQCDRNRENSVCRCCCNGYRCNRNWKGLQCIMKKPKKLRLYDVMAGALKARMERTCPDYPPAPKYGKRACTGGLSFRSYCRYTCDEGSSMVGGDMSICVQRNREYVWNRPAPKCVRNDMCAKLPQKPRNGFMECDGEGEIGNVCGFACNFGYTLQGPSTTTCVKQGKTAAWSHATPMCRPSCDLSSIPIPRNGDRDCAGKGEIGTDCMFHCHRGYKLRGQWLSSCVLTAEGGRWNQEPPECPAICTERLEAPKKGFMECSGNGEAGSTCSFGCQENHRIVGHEESVCIEIANGAMWSRPSPVCEPTCVRQLSQPNYGEVHCSGHEIGAECTFQCNEGFRLIGEASGSCVRVLEGANWTIESPVCEPICVDMPPEPPVNGNVSCTGDGEVGTVCEYQCNIGFRLDGSTAAECVLENEEEAIWSNTPPICIPICHDMPDMPENGRIICDGTGDIGTSCLFLCNEEYEMYGEKMMVCQEYEGGAKWSNDSPICKPIPKCDPAPVPKDGKITCNGTGQLGTHCSFACDKYFEMIGHQSSTCLRDGDRAYWSEYKVFCKEIEPECDPLGDMVHGEVVCDSDVLRKGTTCRFQCTEPGYELLSDHGSEVKCMGKKRDLTWTFKKPCCVKCHNVKKDIVIAMDSSGSIGPEAWENMKKFVQNIVGKFNVSKNDVQFCVFQFSTAARSDGYMYFGRYKKNELIRQIGKMKRMASGTKTGRGLQFAEKRLHDRGNRKDVGDMVWVITDGETEDMKDLEVISQSLRQHNVEILALAINPTENFVGQMTKMTGSEDKVLQAADMSSLSDELVSRIAVKICQESCPAA